jgi:transposase
VAQELAMSKINKSQKCDLKLSKNERSLLSELSRSRLAPAGQVERARIILSYVDGLTVSELARQMNTDRTKIQRCIKRAKEFGVCESLDDIQRSGRKPSITPQAKAWLTSIACQKPVDLGYPHEVWTQELLSIHARNHCLKEGHPSLSKIRKGTVNKFLMEEGIKPHKISYYLEKRDPDFDEKMKDVLCVYQQVDLLKQKGQKKNEAPIAVLSYDEKPGIQAIANTTPDLPPVPGEYPNIARDHEYVRHGTVSLLAGIDLLDGRVHGLVRERHRSSEFIEFLMQVNKAYPKKTRIRVILDNHSAHISKETNAFLLTLPGRFEFVFTPKHGSWLNIVEVLFSKMTRTLLRHIRVHSKAELVSRLEQYVDDLNANPVVFKWSYGIKRSLQTRK